MVEPGPRSAEFLESLRQVVDATTLQVLPMPCISGHSIRKGLTAMSMATGSLAVLGPSDMAVKLRADWSTPQPTAHRKSI